ncbi:carboxylesterase 1D-like [Ostrea edulis]|uniref:carboxylesterase 1D-like n=1 Tax=Ostrea edulis TaxID=37623 RepID=UPI0024AFA7EA|nr:carboxylesterase 1D-like [Ostrea edulis]
MFITKSTGNTNEVEIQTRLGNVIGRQEYSNMITQTVYKFLDIPYGKAPIGNLRFQKPIPFGAWSNTLNATTLGPACHQSKNQPFQYPGFTEDCLKLNIYVPRDVNSSNNKSVMVWFHGGGFINGAGNLYDGGMLSLTGNVIVVTINYRLGILGFLASKNNKAKGNAGLWDQKLALTWIKYNIKDYGGNPNDVTIFGESAGGMSVSLQSLIPSNRGLFNKVIAQSGIANSFLTISNDTLFSTIAVGKKVGCAYNFHSVNDHNFIECLQAADANDLIRATDIFQTELGLNILTNLPFTPIVDGELFHKSPIRLLKDRTSSEFNFFQSLDMMIGTCDNDGSLALSFLPGYERKLNFNFSEGLPTHEMCHTLIPVFSKSLFNSNGEVSNAICKKYTVLHNIEEQGLEFVHMYGDATFIAPCILALSYHSNNIQRATTYQYVFSEEMASMNPDLPWYRGSAHGSDISYMFLFEQLKTTSNFTEGARILVDQMRKYWTNFAKTGNPNGPGLPEWKSFDFGSSHPYMNLQSMNTTLRTNYRKTYTDFWNQDLPNILRHGCNQQTCAIPVVG